MSITEDFLAEVQCRTCKKKKFVPWDDRHSGSNPAAPHHLDVRCKPCPAGKDKTFYTGIFGTKPDKVGAKQENSQPDYGWMRI